MISFTAGSISFTAGLSVNYCYLFFGMFALAVVVVAVIVIVVVANAVGVVVATEVRGIAVEVQGVVEVRGIADVQYNRSTRCCSLRFFCVFCFCCVCVLVES